MTGLRIGYYVHHHGRGHATRAGVIGRELARRGHEVTYLGSDALPEGQHVVLVRDDEGEAFREPEAGGRLHWAPLGGGYAERMQQIAAWMGQARPDVFVVDVSVEVAALVRLLGVPAVVVAQPGHRDDAPHALGYDLAEAVVAPWPAGLDVARQLRGLEGRVGCVGGISRFADTADVFARRGEDASLNGAVLVGGEGWDEPELVDTLCSIVDEVRWCRPSPELPVDQLLAQADVVITHAGQNALADVAAFGVPAVVLAQYRPFGEQADMARALDAADAAAGCLPGASIDEVLPRLREIVAAVRAQPGLRAWTSWNVSGAAERACRIIENAANGEPC